MTETVQNKNKLVLAKNESVALVYRLGTEEAFVLAKKLTQVLKKKGLRVFTAPDQKPVPGTQSAKTYKQMDDLKLIIVLGGDGTYLHAVRWLEGRNTPILGFNMGSLGFLTAHSAAAAPQVLDKLLKGKMTLQPRSMIFAKIISKKKTRGEFHALNDVVIERGSMSQLIYTAIYSENFLVSKVKADGFIVSSPSGSTAYNLAAGGPILHPESPVFTVTPVAPHSLTSRPLIFPDDRELSFKLEGKTHKAHFIVDGQKVAEIAAGDEVVLSRSCYDHWMVREEDHNYFHLLREKLKFGDRD